MADVSADPPFTRLQLLQLGPYRLFFPLGLLSGLWGVGHWVFWSIGWIQDANRVLHVSLQIEGFLASFIVGFIMTAIPRFIGADPAQLWEVAVAFLLELGVLSASLTHHSDYAQISFILLILFVVSFVGKRFPRRTKSPPASFLLVGFGLLNAVTGAAFYGLGLHRHVDLWTTRGQEMLETGFLLCLILGIAGYLLPFLTGYAGDPACDPGHSPLRRLSPSTLVMHGATGLAIFCSFFFPATATISASFLRATAASIHFLTFGQLYRPFKKFGAHTIFFWTACWMIVLGLWATAIWPEFHIAMEHIFFIGGYSLMIFSFGTLVVLSHSAQASLLNGKLIVLKIVGAFTLLGMAFRITADLDAWNYKRWIHFASGCWWVAAFVWLIYILPKLWRIPVVEFDHGPVRDRRP